LHIGRTSSQIRGSNFVRENKDYPLYQATRTAVWNCLNEWFFRGSFKDRGKDITTEGIGSPHNKSWRPDKDDIWPMSMIVRALTSADDAVIKQSLTALRDTTGGKNFIHESFDKDNPGDFTRPWFAWANTLFGELVRDILNRKPNLLV
jgi:uncharacterized protein